MSGVLESSLHALSFRRILSLIGAKFENLLGQKEGYKASGNSEMTPTAGFHHWGKTNMNIDNNTTVGIIS